MTKLKVLAPYDQSLIQELNFHSEQQAEQMLAKAFALYQNREKWLPAYQRIAILEKLCQLMEMERDLLAQLAAHEGGKPLIDSKIEVDRAIQGVKIAIHTLGQLAGKEIPMGLTPATTNRLAFTFCEPIGVVLAISAFNHPLNLIVHQAIPAIAVGCPVIVKPALDTPLSCLKLVELLYQAGLPEVWCQVLICENTATQKLVSDPRVSFLSFIGSGKVGWHLRSLLAPGTHCALEHGGAAPVIVEPDADLTKAPPLLVKGGFYHAGQVCVSVQRVYAHISISHILAEQMAEQASKLLVGDPLEAKTQVGPLIRPTEVERIDAWVKQAVEAGAKLLCGGKPLSKTCYAPTILLNPPDDCLVSNQEIFGPVVCIYDYHERKQAIQCANAINFAFQAAVFTENLSVALETVKQLQAKTVLINDHTAFRADWMPFGGLKASGLGVGGIPYSMRDMVFEKQLILNHN
jgi:acyl-CoA reductase-like NAD-dependent aldehyde dehydrogenase